MGDAASHNIPTPAPLMDIPSVKLHGNIYFLLRHGRSLANEAGIVVSLLQNGLKPEYGLTETGRQQAVAAG